MATKFPNATDKQIDDREQAAFEGQIAVEADGKQRFIDQQGTAAQSGHAVVGNSGVIGWHDDKTFKGFDQPGKKR